MPETPMPEIPIPPNVYRVTQPTVIFAVWGGVRGADDVPTDDVTEKLQTAIDKSRLGGGPNSGHVTINRLTFGDPAGGVHKSFGAVVDYPFEKRRFFAGKEGDTIDFT